MGEIFKKLDFWTLFFLFESSITESEFEMHLKELKQVFFYKKIVYDEDYIINIIEFEFKCSIKHSIILEYKLRYTCDWAESENRLFLENKLANQRYVMGWNDMAQWHPLCIKPNEFDLLVKFWNKNDPQWQNTIYPKLLLKNFIGFNNKSEVENFKTEITEDFRQLNVEIPLSLKETILRVPFYENEEYQWFEHEKLGWVYESKIYNCYSIRNECHSESENEQFPFDEYREMIDSIRESFN